MKSITTQINESKLLSWLVRSAGKDNYITPAFIMLIMWVLSAPLSVFIGDSMKSFVICSAVAVLVAVYFLASKLLCFVLRSAHGKTAVSKSQGVLARFFRFAVTSFRTTPWYFLLTLMLILAFVSACFAEENISYAFFGTSYRNDGFVSYCFYTVIFICAARLRTDFTKVLIVMKLAVIGSLFPCLVSLLQHVGLFAGIKESLSYLTYGDVMYTSVFDNTNHYAYYLTIIIAIAFGLYIISEKKSQRVLFLFCGIFNVWVLVQNNTFGSYLALVVGLIVLIPLFTAYKGRFSVRFAVPLFVLFFVAFAWPRIAVLLAAGLSEALSSVLGSEISISFSAYNTAPEFAHLLGDIESIVTDSEMQDYAGSYRWALWKDTLISIGQHPLLGTGPENMGEFFLAHGTTLDRTHNEYLQHAAFLGIPAAICYLGALGTIAVNRVKKLRSLNKLVLVAGIAVVSYAGSAFFGNTMYYTAPYFFLILGLVVPERTKL